MSFAWILVPGPVSYILCSKPMHCTLMMMTAPTLGCMQNTDVFCRSVLCSQELVAFTDAQFVSWGGDIRQPDAYAVRTGGAWVSAMIIMLGQRVGRGTGCLLGPQQLMFVA